MPSSFALRSRSDFRPSYSSAKSASPFTASSTCSRSAIFLRSWSFSLPSSFLEGKGLPFGSSGAGSSVAGAGACAAFACTGTGDVAGREDSRMRLNIAYPSAAFRFRSAGSTAGSAGADCSWEGACAACPCDSTPEFSDHPR